MLIASIAAKAGWLQVSSGFEWISSMPAMIAFAIAAILEIAAYYIPVVDNFLDALTTPASVVAGTVIAASAFVNFDPMLKWTLAIIAGGGAAGIIQAGTGLFRLGSTKLTAGLGNSMVATTENIFSLFGSVFSLLIPLIMAGLFVAAIIGIFYFVLLKIKKAVR